MAFSTREWKRGRIGDDIDFSLGDGYWFAYISTTTVGLGDVRVLLTVFCIFVCESFFVCLIMDSHRGLVEFCRFICSISSSQKYCY